jgi:isopenicillin-N epimerase
MGDDFGRLWGLDPGVAFLNHGSYGATPLAVLEGQRRWRERMERQPVQFFGRDLQPLLDEVRAAVAAFAGCEPGDLVFVSNATTGVNTVLRWLRLEPGDELLTTNHSYGACRNALEASAAWTGAKVVTAEVPFPLEGEEDVVEAVVAKVTPRTRLALLDHVTSPTALVFPIERLVRELAERGVETLVDGAHGPGMVDLDIGAVGAAWYTGNGHKWLCSPKGAGFLYVRRDLQPSTRPLVISHGATREPEGKSRFQREFEWTGTQDPTPWLGLAEAIAYMGSLLPGGWEEVRARNHTLAEEAQEIIAGALGIERPCPPAMLGSMAAFPLPEAAPGSAADGLEPVELQELLLERGYEAPVFGGQYWGGRPVLRVSCQLYNRRAQYEGIAGAICDLLGR